MGKRWNFGMKDEGGGRGKGRGPGGLEHYFGKIFQAIFQVAIFLVPNAT